MYYIILMKRTGVQEMKYRVYQYVGDVEAPSLATAVERAQSEMGIVPHNARVEPESQCEFCDCDVQ